MFANRKHSPCFCGLIGSESCNNALQDRAMNQKYCSAILQNVLAVPSGRRGPPPKRYALAPRGAGGYGLMPVPPKVKGAHPHALRARATLFLAAGTRPRCSAMPTTRSAFPCRCCRSDLAGRQTKNRVARALSLGVGGYAPVRANLAGAKLASAHFAKSRKVSESSPSAPPILPARRGGHCGKTPRKAVALPCAGPRSTMPASRQVSRAGQSSGKPSRSAVSLAAFVLRSCCCSLFG